MFERLRKAREAYERGDLEETKEAHKPEAIAADEKHKLEEGKYSVTWSTAPSTES